MEIDIINPAGLLNVQEQVYDLAKTSIIQRAWIKYQSPKLHGWAYGLADGIIRPPLGHPIFEYDNLEDDI